MDNQEILVRELCRRSKEESWLEFKKDNYRPDMIGQDISALANSATLADHDYAYMIWGVDNTTHKIVGTEYDLQTLKKGNEELENWLRRLLSPNANFQSSVLEIDGKKVCLLTIHKAVGFPIVFENIKYIRIGSYTKKLQDYPQQESMLWEKLRTVHFEDDAALRNQTVQDIVRLLAVSVYFDKLDIPQPIDASSMMRYLEDDRIVVKQDNGLYTITNVGALLFAKRLKDFPAVEHKAIRVTQYEGKDKLNILKDFIAEEGYAISFDKQVSFIEALLPSSQPIIGALRVEKKAYPSIAIRELLANAILHQDLSERGTFIMVEIFTDRIVITNPGLSLVEEEHLLDSPPQTRNERLTALGRRMHFCEEAGTGWDKTITAIEKMQLPVPRMEQRCNFTIVSLWPERPFKSLSSAERVYACYIHACICYMNGDLMTNASLRERFGLQKDATMYIYRIIRQAVLSGKIKAKADEQSRKFMRYLPVWG